MRRSGYGFETSGVLYLGGTARKDWALGNRPYAYGMHKRERNESQDSRGNKPKRRPPNGAAYLGAFPLYT